MTEASKAFHPETRLKAIRLRKKRGLSEAARAAGMNPALYLRLENGAATTPARAKRLAEFFTVPVTQLFTPKLMAAKPEKKRRAA